MTELDVILHGRTSWGSSQQNWERRFIVTILRVLLQ